MVRCCRSLRTPEGFAVELLDARASLPVQRFTPNLSWRHDLLSAGVYKSSCAP